MKKLFFLSGAVALTQALLIFVTGTVEINNSYRYAITPTLAYKEHTGGAIVLLTPSVLFPVGFYFLFFLVCSFVCAVLIWQRKYLRICSALTLAVGVESFFDTWVLCRRHGYGWIWIPAVRILLALATLYLLSRPPGFVRASSIIVFTRSM